VDFDLTARRRMLRGIVQHIGERLREQAAVELQQRQIFRAEDAQRMRRSSRCSGEVAEWSTSPNSHQSGEGFTASDSTRVISKKFSTMRWSRRVAVSISAA
jgi:hypothetical protein